MKNKSAQLSVSGTPEQRTQDSMEGLKNNKVRNLKNEAQQSALSGAEEINRLVEGVASGTSPTISDDQAEAICKAIAKYVGQATGVSNPDGFCWLGVNKQLTEALQSVRPNAPTEAAVWAVLVLYHGVAKLRMEVSGQFRLQLGLDGVAIRIVVSEVVLQNWPTTAPLHYENALETLASRAQGDHCASEAYVLLNINDDQCAVNGCLTAEGVNAYRAGELKILRVSMHDSAPVDLPLSLKRRPQPGNGALFPSANEVQQIEHAQSLFKRVGDVLEGPDVRKNFLPRETTEEYIRDAKAELGFAKINNLVWNGNPFRGCGPSGEDVYISSIGPNDAHELAINAQHSDSDIIVLALVDEATIFFIGWLHAFEAKKPEWLVTNRNGEPRYRVPEDSLRDISELQVSDQQVDMCEMGQSRSSSMSGRGCVACNRELLVLPELPRREQRHFTEDQGRKIIAGSKHVDLAQIKEKK